MNSRISFAWIITCGLLLSSLAAAQEPPLKMNVWPGKAPGDSGQVGPEQWTKMRVTNVTEPTLTIFRPQKDKNTGMAIIVCPGGGYSALMMDYEGTDVAHWLASQGITGIVLKYRVPAPKGTPRYLPGLQDAQRTMSIVRSKATEWQIDPHRVGILGFSAGGHLAAATSTNFDKRAYPPIDEIDKQDIRPDFAVPIYPGGVIKRGTADLSPEIRVSANTPPMFIVQADNDPVNSENSVYLYLALKHAKVPAELHIYAAGGHGFGMKPSKNPCSTWPQRMLEWMNSRGLLNEQSAKGQ